MITCGCIVSNVGIAGLQHLLLDNTAIDTSIVGNELERVAKRPPHNLSSNLALIIGKCLLDGINLHSFIRSFFHPSIHAFTPSLIHSLQLFSKGLVRTVLSECYPLSEAYKAAHTTPIANLLSQTMCVQHMQQEPQKRMYERMCVTGHQLFMQWRANHGNQVI